MQTASKVTNEEKIVRLLTSSTIFLQPVSVERYYASFTQFIKQVTPPDFPFLLRVGAFDAETPFHFCVKSRPLGEVLQTWAVLLNGQWCEEKADDDSKTAYVLEPKPGAKDHEKALYTATLDLNAEPMVQASRLALRHSPNYWKKEYQQIKSLPHVPDTKSLTSKRLKQANDQFFAQVLALPDGRAQAFFTVFASLTRTQRRTLSDNGYLFLPWNAMNPVQQQNALASRHWASRISPLSANDMTPDENRKAEQKELDSVRRFGVVLSVYKNTVSGRVKRCGLGLGTRIWSVPLPETSSDFVLPVRGNPHLFVFDTEPATAPPSPVVEAKSATIAALETPFPADIRFTPKDTWADVVQTLAQKLPFPIVSDAYSAARCCQDLSLDFFGGETAPAGDLTQMTLAQALDTLCTIYNYLWWYQPDKNDAQTGTLFFRSRAWFVEKRYEPPITVIRSAEAALKSSQKRALSVALVDSVSGLTVPQLQGIAGRAMKSRAWDNYILPPYMMVGVILEGSGGGSASSSFLWLRFWSHLTPEQKQKVVSEGGLPCTQLNDEQKNELVQHFLVPPMEAAALWEKGIVRAGYKEGYEESFSPENAPHWKPADLRPAAIGFAIGTGTFYPHQLPLPVALSPPPPPKKVDTTPKKV